MQPKNASTPALIAALNEVNYQTFIDFTQQLFKQVSLNILIHGNWHKEKAKQLSSTIEQAFSKQLNEDYQVKTPMLDLADKGEFIIPLVLPEHDNAMVIYYPIYDKSLTSIATTMVISQLLSPVFFQTMRTEKQLGYLVGVGFIPINRYPGLSFYIQSPNIDADSLLSEIDHFINHCHQYVSSLSTQDWKNLQQGLASQLQEKDTSLRIRTQRFWSVICHNETNFKQKQELINALLALTLTDITTFIAKVLQPPTESTNPLKRQRRDRICLAAQKTCQQGTNKSASEQFEQAIEKIIKSSSIKY